MVWAKRFFLTLPFLIAAVLSTLMLVADRFHLYRERIAGYGFLFGSPWAWLIELFGVPNLLHHRRLAIVMGYALVLWVPAALYSGCLWLLLYAIGYASNRRYRSQNSGQ